MTRTAERITHAVLADRLVGKVKPVLLDVRRRSAFERKPVSLPGALPVILDVDELQIPDLPRQTPIVTYCLCNGEASSTRAALWLLNAGYENVSVLIGGLPEWEVAGRSLLDINMDTSAYSWRPALFASERDNAIQAARPLLAEESFLAGQTLPMRRDMAVLFVDMVDSTPLLFRHSNERVLEIVQAFMAVVVNVAAHHCGDVHDFEGDGAMLYFAGPGEAVPAAFRLREALHAARLKEPELPEARVAIDMGPLIIGRIGSRFRGSLSFIGPCVNTAARILKHAPPNGIAVTHSVFEHALVGNPDLAEKFNNKPERHILKGMGEEALEIFIAQ